MEISLKQIPKKSETMASPEIPKERYPSFSIYENAPDELMKYEIGTELTATIRISSKEKHEAKDTRQGIGFDVLSVMTNSKPKGQNTEEAMKKAKEYVQSKKEERFNTR